MNDGGKNVGQELKRLMKRKGLSYEKVLKNFVAHANKTSPYEEPPYKDYSSLARIFNGRLPSRPKLLHILIWGLKASHEEINGVLKVADFEVLNRGDIGDLRAQQAPLGQTDAFFVKALEAWRDIDFTTVCDVVTTYYEAKRIPVFSYPCSPGRVPLYVRPEWLNLREASLDMNVVPTECSAQLGEPQAEFRHIYPKIREALGLTKMWNGQIFRLVNLKSAASRLQMQFELGRFLDAFACQYVLEHETRLWLANNAKSKSPKLPLRESLASTTASIEKFCESQAVRVGIGNLVLFRSNKKSYRPAVRVRGIQSMSQTGIFDPMTSCVFDISTYDPQVDFNIQFKVLMEVYEELFGGKEVEREISGLDPDFFFDKKPIKDLRKMLQDGRASFHVTGFCVDLVRIVPDIMTLLIINDDSYYAKYRGEFKSNLEYGPPSHCEIPRAIHNVDDYLANDFPSDPGKRNSRHGFDPSKWSIPGAFCFYQGLKRAVSDGLL